MNKCPSFPTFSLTFLVILFLIFWEFRMSTVYHFHSLPTSNPSVSFLLPPKSMTSLSHTYYIHNRLSPFSVAHTHTYLGLTITFGSPIMGRSQQPLIVCSSGWHVALWYPPHVGMPTGIIAVQGLSRWPHYYAMVLWIQHPCVYQTLSSSWHYCSGSYVFLIRLPWSSPSHDWLAYCFEQWQGNLSWWDHLREQILSQGKKKKKERGRRWNHGHTVVVKGTPTMTWTPLPNARLLKFPPLPRSANRIFKKMDSRGKSRAKPQLYMTEIGNSLPDKHVSLFSLMHTSWEHVRFL